MILSKTGRSTDLLKSILDVVTTRETIVRTRNLVNSSRDPDKTFSIGSWSVPRDENPCSNPCQHNRRFHCRSRSHLTIPWIQTTMHHEADLHNCACFLSSGRLEKSFGLIITIFMRSRPSLMGLFSKICSMQSKAIALKRVEMILVDCVESFAFNTETGECLFTY